MKQCVVVIPVYSESPSRSEKASYQNTLSVLVGHDIVVVTHRDCDTSVYDNISRRLNTNVRYEYFSQQFFSSVHGYNDLCLSEAFYQRFADYEYMLICQLDAWVFRDELSYWCGRGYDYIGAPIFYGYSSKRFSTRVMGIGNGGLSLRRITHAIAVTTAPRTRVFLKPGKIFSIYLNYAITHDTFRKHPLRMFTLPFIIIAKSVGFHNTLRYYIRHHLNEDLIFGSWAASAWGINANIPKREEAIRFSFEVHPELLYKEIGCKLPFGCHAYMKWSYASFWSRFIPID